MAAEGPSVGKRGFGATAIRGWGNLLHSEEALIPDSVGAYLLRATQSGIRFAVQLPQ